MKVEANKTYIGVVEDNKDPKKMGRCRVRVLDVFDNIDVQDIPWASPYKDLNGNQFNVPEKGKVLIVVFNRVININQSLYQLITIIPISKRN